MHIRLEEANKKISDLEDDIEMYKQQVSKYKDKWFAVVSLIEHQQHESSKQGIGELVSEWEKSLKR